MKPLNLYIQEKLIINKNYKSFYKFTPISFDELREIIENRYKELGPGTEQKPIDFNDIDVSNVDSFYNFYRRHTGIFIDTNFKYIDISNWDVSKVKNMKNLFFDCWELKSVGDLSKWDVSKVEDMNGMFDNSGITNIPDWYKG